MDRIKVKASSVKIGDNLNGKNVTSIGKPWSEKMTDEKISGQIWEECDCGKEPVYTSHDCMCKDCINREFGEITEVCYAYFDK